jgi:hypothetical protein
MERDTAYTLSHESQSGRSTRAPIAETRASTTAHPGFGWAQTTAALPRDRYGREPATGHHAVEAPGSSSPRIS